MKNILENNFIDQLTNMFKRSPYQMNNLHEADSEIIFIEQKQKLKIAVTTDSIVEEISSGLYSNPYMIGWMIVMVNLSDLAAVGANTVGIMISETLTPNLDEEFINLMHIGISDACNKCNTFVLGGDTNFGSTLMLTGCALGIIEDKSFMMRKGCKTNELLYSSGFLGGGNAYALSKLMENDSKNDFKPTAKNNIGKIISDIATSCMDTSDGLISSLDQLMRINNIGFKLNKHWESFIERSDRKIAHKNQIPLWLLLAGQHGEFELIFTIDKKDENNLKKLAKQINWRPLKLGKSIERKEIIIPIYDSYQKIDSAKIRNLAFDPKLEIVEYIKELLLIDKTLKAKS